MRGMQAGTATYGRERAQCCAADTVAENRPLPPLAAAPRRRQARRGRPAPARFSFHGKV